MCVFFTFFLLLQKSIVSVLTLGIRKIGTIFISKLLAMELLKRNAVQVLINSLLLINFLYIIVSLMFLLLKTCGIRVLGVSQIKFIVLF